MDIQLNLDELTSMATSLSIMDRIAFLREQGLEPAYLADYFDLNPKSFFNIQNGKTKNPRPPFTRKLGKLEESIRKRNEKRADDNRLIYNDLTHEVERANKTKVRLAFINEVFGILNEKKQGAVVKDIFDSVYAKTKTTNKELHQKSLGFK